MKFLLPKIWLRLSPRRMWPIRSLLVWLKRMWCGDSQVVSQPCFGQTSGDWPQTVCEETTGQMLWDMWPKVAVMCTFSTRITACFGLHVSTESATLTILLWVPATTIYWYVMFECDTPLPWLVALLFQTKINSNATE